jgi:predicted TIM-barrel fold metal-dependent hydrolase
MRSRTICTRRSFTRVGLASMAACSGMPFGQRTMQAADTAANADGFVDAHVHVWTPDLDRYPLAADFTKADMQPASFTDAELLAAATPLGISRIVLIQMSYYGFDNRYMLDCMAAQPGVFGGVAIVDHDKPDITDTMQTMAKQGVRGFRLYTDRAKAEAWQQSEGMKRMWTAGAEQGLAMCLLANPDALPAVQRMCEAFPKTPVVIDHFARIGMRGAVDPQQLALLTDLARFPTVHVKVSAYYALGNKTPPYDDLEPMIESLRDAYGAERLMWASDGPFQLAEGQGYEPSLALIRDRCRFLKSRERDAILRGTASRVFFG